VIAGLYNYAVEGATLGLFAYTEKATIKNLCLTNTYFSNEQVSTYHTHTGAIIGSAFGGAVENVYTDAILDGGHNLGMVAFFRNHNLVMRECWFDGIILPPATQSFYAGGLVGQGFYHKDAKLHGGLLLENCLFTGTITGGTDGESSSFVGGLVGITPTGGENLPESKTKVVNCISSGSIMTDAAYVGSLFGSCSWKTGYTELENVYAANETYINSEGSPQAMNPDRIGTTALVGTFELIPMEDLLGDKAKENATGLDYDSVWTTIEYKLPELINITKTPYKNKFSIDYSTMVDIIDKIRLRTNSNNKYTASSVPTGIDEVYEAGKSVGGSIVYVNAEEVSF
jgi:hypothetical protein